jgi:predicted N-acetyltransferase YhbS
VQLVEVEQLGDAEWAQLSDGEEEPFGRVGHSLQWEPKQHRLGLRDGKGRLVAAAGAVVVPVEVEGSGTFDVVGIGGVIVTHTLRGKGLFWQVVEPLLALAGELGPERAMLFCRDELRPLYARLGFQEIAAPVSAAQPGGRIEMPMAAMWLALRDGAEWPSGRVNVPGLPF